MAVHTQCQKLQVELQHACNTLDSTVELQNDYADILSAKDIISGALKLCSHVFDRHVGLLKRRAEDVDSPDSVERLHGLLRQREICAATIGFLISERAKLDVAVMAASAAALVAAGHTPVPLTPLVRALLNSVKREPCKVLQELSSRRLVDLMLWCKGNNKSKVAERILHKTCAYLRDDDGCLPDLISLQLNRCNPDQEAILDDASLQVANRGANMFLAHICTTCGDSAFKVMPALEALVTSSLARVPVSAIRSGKARALSDLFTNGEAEIAGELRVCASIYVCLDSTLIGSVLSLLPAIICCIRRGKSPMLAPACQCVATIASRSLPAVMDCVLTDIIPIVTDVEQQARLGAVCVLHEMIMRLELKVLPFIVVFVIPLLGTTSDVDSTVRMIGTACFSMLVNLMPLESGAASRQGMSKMMATRYEAESGFVNQLMGELPPDVYPLPTPLKSALRTYQQEGVNWMAFLNKFRLHGILCDEVSLASLSRYHSQSLSQLISYGSDSVTAVL